jgi:hypothetical protein
MKKDCKKYVINCVSCQRFKVYNNQKQKLLTSLFIFQRKWRDLSLNFVIKLSKCHRRNRTYENILIIVDKLTKRRLYKFMTDIETKIVLKVLERRIFSTYDLSNFLIHDRDSQFTVRLWRWICSDTRSNSDSFQHITQKQMIRSKMLINSWRIIYEHMLNTLKTTKWIICLRQSSQLIIMSTYSQKWLSSSSITNITLVVTLNRSNQLRKTS